MAPVKILARGFSFYILTDPVELVYTPIRGIRSLSMERQANKQEATGYDSPSSPEHVVASRSVSLSLEGIRIEDVATGERDPGQQAVEDLAQYIGPLSQGTFRMITPSGSLKDFVASPTAPKEGGGVDDPMEWSIDLAIAGKPADRGPFEGVYNDSLYGTAEYGA